MDKKAMDWDLKSLLEQALEEARREERYGHGKLISDREKDQQQKEILEKESRFRKEERKYRENRIIERIRQEFWKRGTQSEYE